MHTRPEANFKMGVCLTTWKCSSLSHVQLFATPWTVARQAPLPMGFSRQEYWSGKPFPPPGDLVDSGMDPGSPALQADSYCLSRQGSPSNYIKSCLLSFSFTGPVGSVHFLFWSSQHTVYSMAADFPFMTKERLCREASLEQWRAMFARSTAVKWQHLHWSWVFDLRKSRVLTYIRDKKEPWRKKRIWKNIK